ncbi:hypothetical protein J6590_107136 [Homalodisca vitripennis]|nr:hypothetical protein J6590_107136 [Homalodisca vitripennis]
MQKYFIPRHTQRYCQPTECQASTTPKKIPSESTELTRVRRGGPLRAASETICLNDYWRA